MDYVLAAVFGIAGGLVGGMLGVGGGILFVPALTIFLNQSQLHAEATSLLAIVPVAVAGAWRQNRYGNVRLQDAAVIGVLSPVGVLIGVLVSNAVPERALELSFAGLMLLIAVQLGRRAFSQPAPRKAPPRG